MLKGYSVRRAITLAATVAGLAALGTSGPAMAAVHPHHSGHQHTMTHVVKHPGFRNGVGLDLLANKPGFRN